MSTHLIHFIPERVEILLDHVTLKHFLPNGDVCVGVALAFHHTAHFVVFGNQILSLQEDESEQALEGQNLKINFKFLSCIVRHSVRVHYLGGEAQVWRRMSGACYSRAGWLLNHVNLFVYVSIFLQSG